ncbi:hypothetical protein GQ457_03G010470 [Hibiscus cannabinus]
MFNSSNTNIPSEPNHPHTRIRPNHHAHRNKTINNLNRTIYINFHPPNPGSLPRLSEALEEVISDSQCACIKGRQIFNGILIANEIAHTLQEKLNLKENIILKLDFTKAYDCVLWDFLKEVQSLMGFGLKWRSWNRECISTATVSVLVNGSPTYEFHMRRGLRQGDPISAILFIIFTEDLHQKGKHLPFAEKVTLINSVISALRRVAFYGAA